MANYVKSTNFLIKDSLVTGDPNKVIKGSEIDTEFNNVQTAVNSKSNTNSPAFTGVPTAPTPATTTNTTQLATTAFVKASEAALDTIVHNWTNTNTFSGIIKITNGTLGQRPGGTAGIIRYNTTYGQFEGTKSVTGKVIDTLTRSGTTATLTTVTPHGLTTGQTIVVAGCVPSAYNGEYLVTVVNSTSVTYVMASDPLINASTIGTYTGIFWGQLGGGATGSNNDQVFVLNDQIVTVDYAIPSGKNASTTGDITIDDGVTVTIPSGSRWVII